MDGDERREVIVRMLKESTAPISGSAFSKELNVSRQIVVGDIALIRAGGMEITSTNAGYVLSSKEKEALVTLKLKFGTEDMYDVFCTIIDEGAKVKEIYVDHGAFGRIVVPMNIDNRADIRRISESLLESGDKALGELTKGVQFFVISAESQFSIIRAQKALNDKGYFSK